MRPVNLIPPDARRGQGAQMRVGAVSYVVLAALAAALLGAVALGFTGKQVSDREAEVSQLNQELQEATARAQALSAFAGFRAVQESRTATVSSLAQSRFDWERVMNELALVIPADVWLIEMTGTVSPAVQLESGADVALRDSVTGPALELVGCAPGQDAVAGFVADLEDIDGVTRVGVASSERPEPDSLTTGTEVTSDSATDSVDDCRTRDFISRFEIVVAFDAVPVPGTATSAPSVPASVAPAGSDTADGGLAQVQSQQATSAAQNAQRAADAEQAANLIPGG